MYGIWINDRKVSNEAIGAYKNTDISWYMIQLNVMTNEYFTNRMKSW